MKSCSICNVEKDLSNFKPQSRQCRDCKNQKRCEERKLKKEELNDKQSDTKTCTKCEKELSITMFKVNTAQCNDCINERRRELRASKKPPKPVPINPDNKICKYCEKEQEPTNFRHNRLKCLDCERKDGREYRQSDYGKEKSKQWMDQNKDFAFKLRRNIGSRINYILKKNNKANFVEAIKYINCTIDYLKDWLKFCFTEDMTEDNYGSYWEVDHVIPIDKFKFENDEDIKLCFSWFNLMPLTENENGNKYKNINKEQINKHLQNLKDFGVNPQEYIQLCATHLDAGNTC